MIASADARAAAIAADFPILAKPTSRGKRLVYLDSAASSQKPQAVIDALVDYYSSYNANIHRGVYEIAARATDAFEEARAKVARFVNAAHSAEIIWTRNTTEAINLVSFSWGLQNLRPGDAILTTQVEHHSNLVPWQLLAAKTGAELRYIEAERRRHAAARRPRRAARAAPSSSRSRTSATCSARSRRSRRSSRAPTPPARWCWSTPRNRCRTCRSTCRRSTSTFSPSAATRCARPTGIGFLYGKRALLEAMPPFLTGGDMIRTVAYDTTTFAELPWKFEAGTSNIADAIAFGTACDYLTEASAWRGFASTRSRSRAYALERLAPFAAARPASATGRRGPRTAAA